MIGNNTGANYGYQSGTFEDYLEGTDPIGGAKAMLEDDEGHKHKKRSKDREKKRDHKKDEHKKDKKKKDRSSSDGQASPTRPSTASMGTQQLQQAQPDQDAVTRAMDYVRQRRASELGALLASSPGLATYSDPLGESLLHHAAKLGLPEQCELLLHAGAPVNAQDQLGQTPLYVACVRGYVRVVQLLLSWKDAADPAIVDQLGRTPLHAAASRDHASIVYALLQFGAERHALDRAGATAAEAAFEAKALAALDHLISGAEEYLTAVPGASFAQLCAAVGAGALPPLAAMAAPSGDFAAGSPTPFKPEYDAMPGKQPRGAAPGNRIGKPEYEQIPSTMWKSQGNVELAERMERQDRETPSVLQPSASQPAQAFAPAQVQQASAALSAAVSSGALRRGPAPRPANTPMGSTPIASSPNRPTERTTSLATFGSASALSTSPAHSSMSLTTSTSIPAAVSAGAAGVNPQRRRGAALHPLEAEIMLPKRGRGSTARVGRYGSQLIVFKKTGLPQQTSQQTTARDTWLRDVKALSHPNVLPIFSAGILPDGVLVLMPFCERRDLGYLLRQIERGETAALTEDAVVAYALGLASALDVMNGKGLHHGNVRASNVMLSSDRRHVMLADAAMTCVWSGENNFMGPRELDLVYHPPEVVRSVYELRRKSPPSNAPVFYGEKTDVYSFGIVLMEMVLARSLLPSTPESLVRIPLLDTVSGERLVNIRFNEFVEHVQAGARVLAPQGQFNALLSSCLHVSPQERPSFNDVIIELEKLSAARGFLQQEELRVRRALQDLYDMK